MRKFGGRARPRFLAPWSSTGALNGQIQETFTGHAVVKSFGRQKEVEERFRGTNDELYESSFVSQFMSSLMQPLTIFLVHFHFVLFSLFCFLLFSFFSFSFVFFHAFFHYSLLFFFPFSLFFFFLFF